MKKPTETDYEYPEHCDQAFRVFLMVANQWRYAPASAEVRQGELYYTPSRTMGLDLTVVFSVLDRHDLDNPTQLKLLREIQLIESGALSYWDTH
jgi:hypothetical protein